MKKKSYWKQLLISILSFTAIKEATESVINNPPINILKNQKLLSEIIDNINFFIYDSNFNGWLNENSLKIYEFGLFKKNKNNNRSISFLFYYAFNVTTNVHEICGHYNILFQSFSSVNSCESPKINENQKSLFSPYANLRKKESGEKVEKTLFGKRIRFLSVKEALFILNPLNYIEGKEDFQKNFNECNIKTLKDLLPKYVSLILKNLGININEIYYSNTEEIKSIKNNSNEFNNDEIIEQSLPNHNREFYIDDSDAKF